MSIAAMSMEESISEGIDVARFSSLAPAETLWQSEYAWCNQQDKSQTEAEAELETMRIAKSAANELVMRCMARYYCSREDFSIVILSDASREPFSYRDESVYTWLPCRESHRSC